MTFENARNPSGNDPEARLSSPRCAATAVSLPELDGSYFCHDLSRTASVRHLEEQLSLVPSGNLSNRVYVHRDASRLRVSSTVLFGGRNNVVVIDADCGFTGQLRFEGDDNLVVLRGGQGIFGLEAHLYTGDTLLVGRKAAAWGVRAWVQGGKVCSIGDDCILSENISIRTTDHHSIIDLATWEQINEPADVAIGRHVWVGAGVSIVKGVRIGDGAIIAVNSTVTMSVPAREMWGGLPRESAVPERVVGPLAPGHGGRRRRASGDARTVARGEPNRWRHPRSRLLRRPGEKPAGRPASSASS